MDDIEPIVPDIETTKQHEGIVKRLQRETNLEHTEAKAHGWSMLLEEYVNRVFPENETTLVLDIGAENVMAR